MLRVLCYGDSNTHGTPPIRDQRVRDPRYGADVRWPGVMRQTQRDWDVIEEGLPGRTAQFADPVMGAHMEGGIGLRIALASHGPIDVLTIMLGTNDLKTRFGADAGRITAGIAGLLAIANSAEIQDRHDGFKTLLICPPPVIECGVLAPEFYGAAEVSWALATRYEALAVANDAGFLDASQVIEVSPVDGIHYDPASHASLGQAVAAAVLDLIA